MLVPTRLRCFPLRIEWLEDRDCPSVFYDLQVVAQTGGAQAFTSLGDGPSINDNGYVAFVGRTAGANGTTLENVYSVDPQTQAVYKMMNPAFELQNSGSPANSFFSQVQLNNSNEILARRRQDTTVQVGFPFGTITSAPLSYLEEWDATKDYSQQPSGQKGLPARTVAGGDGGAAGAGALLFFLNPATGGVYPSPFALNSAFAGFFNWSSQNNNGEVVAGAIMSNANGGQYAVVKPTSSYSFLKYDTGGVRPALMIADDGTVVYRDADKPGPIIILNANLQKIGEIGTTLGFTQVGVPSISDDGKVIAFVGDRGAGMGVFIAFRDPLNATIWKVERVAGENTSPSRELGVDATGNSINFQSFDLANRVSVVHQSLGASGLNGDTVEVSFIGTPSSASIANTRAGGQPLLFSAAKGLWTVRADFALTLDPQPLAPGLPTPPPQLVVHANSSIPVVQVGDVVRDSAGNAVGGAITDLTTGDALSLPTKDAAGASRTTRLGDHQIVFRAVTASGEMLVKGKHLDSDEDGLLDHWETQGIDIDQDGRIDLDLRAMGANPNHRDLFLEIDRLANRTTGVTATWKHELTPGVGQFLVNMFAAAPALANGISAGITLHLDAGSGQTYNMGSGRLEGGDVIGMAGQPNTPPDVVYLGLPNSINVTGLNARSLTDIKSNFFGTNDKRARELAFRYAVFADFHSLWTSDLGATYIGAVKSATSNVLTAVANVPLSSSGAQESLAGHAVKITSGRGAGQIRTILADHTNVPALGPNQFGIDGNWAVIPDATSTFAILDGSSGLSEAGFYPSPDNGGIPGNDLLLTLGTFGTDPQGRLGTQEDQERTIAHELGHTLGLRHGGIDHTPQRIASGKSPYLSLMSYDFQLAYPSAVNSYSTSGDPTYDDWSNLHLGFQESFTFLGNSNGLDPFGTIRREPLPVRIAVGGDQQAPTVSINKPQPGDTSTIGSQITVEIFASDNVGVSGVEIEFDADGDGLAESYTTTIDPLSGAFVALIPSVVGTPGTRTMKAIARDAVGNSANATVSVTVQAVPTNRPPVAGNDSASTVAGGSVAIPVLGNDNDPDGTLNLASVAITTNPAHGTVSVNAATGVVTYTPAAGYTGTDSFQYTVRDNLGAVSNPATVTVSVAAPLAVTGVTVGDGSAQRSNIESLTIAFNQDTNLATLIQSGAITGAVRVRTSAGTLLTLAANRYRYNAATFTLTLDLSTDGFGGSAATLLADDRFTLELDTAQILAASGPANPLRDDDGTADGVRKTAFHRLFGDFDGDGSVTIADRVPLQAAFGKSRGQAGYQYAFDFDGDGTINANDYLLWTRRIGKKV